MTVPARKRITPMEEGTAQLAHHPPFRFRLRTERQVLHFRRPARTSRGDLLTREIYRVQALTPDGIGTGDCCCMPGLSPEAGPGYSQRLEEACRAVERQGGLLPRQLQEAPSLRFGIESALLAARRPGLPRWDSPLARGERGLEIHHLIWMDTAERMLLQMEEGVQRGFRRLKLKVGALPFEEERDLLQEARRRFPECELYVDANGALSPTEALPRLEALAACGVHCIEQPLAPGQEEELAHLIQASPLPIALDEELLTARHSTARRQLLERLQPHAIVIKPSLHGGLSGAEEWAALAEAAHIRWWLNSALESHVGLDTLAEWCGRYAPDTIQGLGTGRLFTDDSPGLFQLEGRELRLIRPQPDGF